MHSIYQIFLTFWNVEEEEDCVTFLVVSVVIVACVLLSKNHRAQLNNETSV